MLRTNLNPDRRSWLRVPWGLISFLLLGFALWQGYAEHVRNKERERDKSAAKTSQEKLTALESERQRLGDMDLAKQATTIQARNEWVTAKHRSPVRLLAALEARLPEGVEVRGLQAGLAAGELLAVGPELDTLTRWFNAVFPGQSGKLTVESRDGSRLLCRYTWTIP